MHAVILVILKCLFILVCRSKSPTGLMLHVVHYSTQNKISMSMVNTLVGSKLLFTCIGHGNSTCFIAI